jgi:hypothetical protein
MPEPNENTKWVKLPTPGEYRGEGQWVTITKIRMPENEWQRLHEMKTLPTHIGKEPPAS